MTKRILWVDVVKALCMVCVMYAHCESYYSIPVAEGFTDIFHPFYVSAFYFVSGYLFISSCISKSTRERGRKFWNVIFRIIVPTMLFSAAMYLPKLLFHGAGLDIMTLIKDVLLGNCFWFTASLAVAELIILAIVSCFKMKKLWQILVASVLLAVLAMWLSQGAQTYYPWYYRSGMFATLFIALGGLYQKYEDEINKAARKALWLIQLLYLAGVVAFWQTGEAKCGNILLNYNIAGTVMTILGILTVVLIAQIIPAYSWLLYIGRNSLVYYFFCGLLPAAFSVLATNIFGGQQMWVPLMLCITCMLVATVFVYIINRWLPWLLDIRKIKS